MSDPAAATPYARIPYDACPLCDTANPQRLLVADATAHPHHKPVLPGAMQWMQCPACEHIFTDGYWPPEALDLLFESTQQTQGVGINVEQDRHKWATVVDKVSEVLGGAGGAWLDVGFGRGTLLFTAAEWGYDGVGIDLREDNVTALQSMGLEAHRIDLADYQEWERFSVVSMADALEHFPFPRQAVEHVTKLLRPGGLAFLSMPNYDTIVWRTLDQTKTNPYWIVLQHYHNFNRKRLYALLEAAGLTPVRYGVSDRYRAGMDVIARKDG